MNAIGSAICQSAQDFADHVWPHIGPNIGGGTFVSLEAEVSNRLADDLDMICGIDMLHYPASGGIRGIASRVQYLDPAWASSYPWDTFTIRRTRPNSHATEYEKRLAAIDSNGAQLYPYLTIQAYLVDRHVGPCLSVAAVRTADLIRHVQANLDTVTVRTVKGGTTMFVVPWAYLEDAGVRIAVVRP